MTLSRYCFSDDAVDLKPAPHFDEVQAFLEKMVALLPPGKTITVVIGDGFRAGYECNADTGELLMTAAVDGLTGEVISESTPGAVDLRTRDSALQRTLEWAAANKLELVREALHKEGYYVS